jgi:nitroimidazol reductase NimA-like FMN-containing flavoprotein (pyridoxamine 5'-phosphate oxidase superfamily)
VARLEELSTEECWTLVESADPLARIAWNGSTGPALIPVNYAVHDRSIWIRTTAYSAMAEEIDESLVAVLIDDVDRKTHLGWSVALRGRSEILYHQDQVPDRVRALSTWPGGARPLWVHLAPRDVTGRRLVAD